MRLNRLPPLILALFLGDGALGLAYLINEMAGRPREGLSRLVDLNGEANFPSWFSSMQALCAGLLLGTFARRHVTRGNRASWALVLLPVVLIAMSCDEVSQLHERIGGHSDALLAGGSRANTIFVHTGIWMFVVGIPFIVFLAWLVLRARRYMAHVPGAMAKFILGFVVFLTGSLVFDGISNAFTMHSRAFAMSVLVEETLEMIGITIVCWSALDLAYGGSATQPRSVMAAMTEGVSVGMEPQRTIPSRGNGAEDP